MKSENKNHIQWASLESEPQKKIRDVWTGVYKGINFEINKFRFGENDDEERWTHYIILNLDQQFPKEVADLFWLKPEIETRMSGAKTVRYDYWDSPIQDLEFHGGCTFYEKMNHVDEEEGFDRWVKIGCDYQHSWDHGRQYDLSYVHSEVRATIKDLIQKFGEPKVRSVYDGTYKYLHEFDKDEEAK